jgi:hypothetical protein
MPESLELFEAGWTELPDSGGGHLTDRLGYKVQLSTWINPWRLIPLHADDPNYGFQKMVAGVAANKYSHHG